MADFWFFHSLFNDHSFIVQSLLPVAILGPFSEIFIKLSGWKVIEFTLSEWPFRVVTNDSPSISMSKYYILLYIVQFPLAPATATNVSSWDKHPLVHPLSSAN